MKFLIYLSDFIIPLFIFYVVGYGLLNKSNVYDDFVRGAKDGMKTVAGILPTLIGLMVAVGILRASGFLEWFCSLPAQFTERIGLPAPLLPVMIVRMFSSSAATGLVLDIFKEYGTDSRIGLITSIMMSCTDIIVILRRNEEYLQRQGLEFVLVRMRDGLSQMIINVESQKDEPAGYDLLDRAVFYVSRLISSQKDRDFVHTSYNDIRRVFSIWVCMNLDENSMGYVHLAYDKLIGDYQCKGRLDLLNIVLIGLSNELPGHDEKYELHRLLGALLSKQLSVDEKLAIIEKEYNIPAETDIRRVIQ